MKKSSGNSQPFIAGSIRKPAGPPAKVLADRTNQSEIKPRYVAPSYQSNLYPRVDSSQFSRDLANNFRCYAFAAKKSIVNCSQKATTAAITAVKTEAAKMIHKSEKSRDVNVVEATKKLGETTAVLEESEAATPPAESSKPVELERSITGNSSFINWEYKPNKSIEPAEAKTFISTLNITLEDPDGSGFVSPDLGALCEQIKKL